MAVKSEEAIAKKKAYQYNYYHEHKHDPEYIAKRRIRDRARYLRDPLKHAKAAVDRRDNMGLGDSSFKGLVLTRARGRAKKYDLEFDITSEDIKWNTHCPVFGFELQSSQTNGKGDSDLSLSLDRIDSTMGYVRKNVRTISNRANKLKNNMTKEECELILKNWDKV